MGGKHNPEYQKRYREEHAEKIRAYQREWYLKKREDPAFLLRLKENARRATEKRRVARPASKRRIKTWTPEKQREYHREWSARNRARVLELGRQFRERNREKIRARVSRLNALKGKEYSRRYRQNNPEKRREAVARYYVAHKEQIRAKLTAYAKTTRGRALMNARAAQRRAAKKQATPAWANQWALDAVYAEATRMTQETGIQHDVDHIVPLQGKRVCGLHVENNLQILQHVENVSKGNRLKDAA